MLKLPARNNKFDLSTAKFDLLVQILCVSDTRLYASKKNRADIFYKKKKNV